MTGVATCGCTEPLELLELDVELLELELLELELPELLVLAFSELLKLLELLELLEIGKLLELPLVDDAVFVPESATKGRPSKSSRESACAHATRSPTRIADRPK